MEKVRIAGKDRCNANRKRVLVSHELVARFPGLIESDCFLKKLKRTDVARCDANWERVIINKKTIYKSKPNMGRCDANNRQVPDRGCLPQVGTMSAPSRLTGFTQIIYDDDDGYDHDDDVNDSNGDGGDGSPPPPTAIVIVCTSTTN